MPPGVVVAMPSTPEAEGGAKSPVQLGASEGVDDPTAHLPTGVTTGHVPTAVRRLDTATITRERSPRRVPRRPGYVAIAACGGAITATAFAPWGSPLLAPVGVAVFVAVARATPTRWATMRAGGFFGAAFMGLTLSWMWASLGMGPWLALTFVQALWFALVGLGWFAVRELPGWPVWCAAVWTAIEGLRATWPLGGMPWGRLGFSAPDAPWAMVLPWVGVSGTTFLIALAGCALAGLTRAAWSRQAPSGAAHGALLVALGTVAATAQVASPVANAVAATTASNPDPDPDPDPVPDPVPDAVPDVDGPPGESTEGQARVALVGVVQGGVPGSGTRVVENHRQVTRNHLAESVRLADRVADQGVDLSFVLWPENATAVDPTTDPTARAAVLDAVDALGVPIVAGSPTAGPSEGTARNETIVWTDAGPGQRYTKQHLVPFGEYVPFRGLAAAISSRVAEISRDMVPGQTARPLEVAGVRIASAICFDVAYDDVIGPQVADGAELVTISTSNAMFLGTAQLEQQWMISRARALETGRSVVVASINGISGAIGPDGTVIARLPERETGSMVVAVPLLDTITPAIRLGPWPQRSALTLAVVGLLWSLVLRRARHRRASTLQSGAA